MSNLEMSNFERGASTSLAIASYAQRERHPWPGFVANQISKSRHLGVFESPNAARAPDGQAIAC